MNEKLKDKTFLKIETIYAFVAQRPDSGEGIMGFLGPDGTMIPMIGADLERVKDLKPIADMMSRELKTPYKIYHFTKREIYKP